MTVEVKYRGPNKWAVIETKRSTSGGFGWRHHEASTHRTRKAAVKAARRTARDGEKISLVNSKGQVQILRQGVFLP